MHLPQVSARSRATAWAALSLLFIVSLPAVTARFYAADEIEYFAYLRSMWFDGDLSFDNEYRYFYERGIAQGRRSRPGGGEYGDRFYITFLAGTTTTGMRNNFAPIGTAILWAPFFAAADAGVRIARVLGSDVAADGLSQPYIAAVTYGTAVYGFAALLISGAIARRLAGEHTAAIVAAWLGTPLLFYMYLAPGFSHACSAFAVAVFVALWLHVRKTWTITGAVALGAWAALMGMVREQDLFVAVGPAADFLIGFFRSGRFDVKSVMAAAARAGAAVAALVVGFLPQLAAYQILYGRPGPSPTVERKMTWTSPNAWLVLASPENGWLFWTPLVVPALAGLAWLALRKPGQAGAGVDAGDTRRIAALCLLMVLSQIYVAGCLDTWAGAGSFGQRRLVGLTVFLVIGMAGALAAVRGWARAGVAAFAVAAVWWNLGLTVQYGSGMMNRQHLDIPRNAYNNFIAVPRALPGLAYRYFMNRSSFYANERTHTP